MSTDPGATTLLDLSGESRQETVRTDAYLGEVRGVVDMHLAIAGRLLREGATLRAFHEMVRASRAVPMNARLAAGLVRHALRAGTHSAAATLLADGRDDAEGDEAIDVQRQVARLARRSGDLDRAQEVLAIILAGRPDDRRARAVLNAILARRQRWEELDGSLEKETREALRRGHLRAASRSALRRARLWGETLEDPARAALRAMQAAQYAEQGKDLQGAFLLRLLWIRSLHRANAPGRALEEAARIVLAAGDRVGQRESAQSLVDELGLGPSTASGESGNHSVETTPLVPTVNSVSGEQTPTPAAPPRRRSTQLELVAVAEAAEGAGRKPEAAAILAAAVREGPDPRAAQKLEAHFIQRGAWRELADFYRDALKRAATKPERGAWGEKLAELLESELSDIEGAARAWAEVAAATGDPRAVSEQVRLLAQQKDQSGIREALDAGVKRAQATPERARALVLRAEEALTRHDAAAARADFEGALKLVPNLPEAAAGVAELAAQAGDPAPIRTFERALAAVPKQSPGRAELFRRLARLADSPLRDAKLSRHAWGEVLAEHPGDEEATARLLALTRVAGDDVALEALLHGALAREPRGPRARQQRMELVTVLERAGRDADALAALKDAVRFEPGHREAWLAYAERLIALGGRDGEAAWALEHAATATEAPAQRLKLWQRLARFVREQLGDEARAETYEKRVEKIQRELMQNAPPASSPPIHTPLPGGPLVTPKHRALKPRAAPLPPPGTDFEALAAKLGARVEVEQKSTAHVRIAPHVAKQLETLGARPGPPVPSPPAGPATSNRSLPPVPSPPEAAHPSTSNRSLPPVASEPAHRGESARSAGPTPSARSAEPAAPGRAPPHGPAGASIASRASAAEPGRNSPPSPPSASASSRAPAGEPGRSSPPPPPSASTAGRAPATESGRSSPPLPSSPATSNRSLAPVVVPPPVHKPRPGKPPPALAGAPTGDTGPDGRPDEPTSELRAGELDADETPLPSPPASVDPDDAVEELSSGDVEVPDDAARLAGPVPRYAVDDTGELPEPDDDEEDAPRRTAELPLELGDPSAPVPPSFGPSPSKALSAERQALFERVRQNPLDPDGYRMLAEHFDMASDATRSSLMLEIARALEGDPHAAPRTPRLILNATDRAGLKHPSLRGEGGELLGLVGVALCRLSPARGKDAGTDHEFNLDAGKGARAVADALLAAVRILGVRSPDVYLTEEPGPPLGLVFTTEPRILVGKLAVKKEVSDAELRFFAGRVLFTQQPDLMALRSLRREQLLRGLVLVTQVVEGRASPAETRVFRDAVPARAWERLKTLIRAVGTRVDLAQLTDGARHSANRAGLVVCGGIAPAIASLRAKKALPSEMMELVRFAASERYLQLRNRNLPRR